MAWLSTTFPNPLVFTALTNGLVLLIIGILLCIDIYPVDYGSSSALTCGRYLYPFPALVLLASLIYFGYIIVATGALRAICCSGEGETNEADLHSRLYNRDQNGQWQRPAGFIICSFIATGVILTGSVISIWGIDFCGGTMDIWFSLALGLWGFSAAACCTSLLFCVKSEKLACGINMKPLRYFIAQYLLVFPFILLWVIIPCSPEQRDEHDDVELQSQKKQTGQKLTYINQVKDDITVVSQV